jgi:hypothetical protein
VESDDAEFPAIAAYPAGMKIGSLDSRQPEELLIFIGRVKRGG